MNCPVCNKEMKEQEVPYLLACDPSSVKMPELNEENEIITTHATYALNSEGKVTFKSIEVLPYIFEIHDDPKSLRQTRISKIIAPVYDYECKANWCRFGSLRLMREQLVVVPGVVNIQWNDPQAVLDRVKMYLLFS